MEKVWQPVVKPPKLSRYSHLSEDGQRVMAAICRYYEEQKQHILNKQTQVIQPIGCSKYYQSIYARKFGTSPAGSRQSNTSCSNSNMPVYVKHEPVWESQKSSASNVTSPQQEEQMTERVDVLKPATESTPQNRPCLHPKQQLMYIPNKSVICHDNSDDKLPMVPVQESSTTIGCMNQTVIQEETGIQDEFYIPPVVTTCIDGIDNSTTDSNRISNTEALTHGSKVNKHVLKDPERWKDANTCSVTKRLLEHQQIRASDGYPHSISDSSSSSYKRKTADAAPDNNPEAKKRIDQFFIPYKKQKKLPSESPKPCFSNNDGKATAVMENCASEDFLDVSSISHLERQRLLSNIKNSKEVTLTLVYTDNSTQLRKHSCSQVKSKKKTAHIRNQPVNEVQFICVKPSNHTQQHIEANSLVLLLPVKSTDRELSEDLRKFWDALLSSDTRKICFNAKELLLVLLQSFERSPCGTHTHTVTEKVLNTVILDPLIASWLLDPDHPSLTFCQALSTVSLHQKEADGRQPRSMLKEDMAMLSDLMGRLSRKLSDRELWGLFYFLETKLVSLLAILERTQIKVNMETFLHFSDIMKKKLIKLEKKAHEIVGHSFSLNSPAQLRQVLFEELKLDTKLPQKAKLAKTNINHETSTSESVLTQLITFHQLPSIILEYRQVQKIKSTFVDGIKSCVRDEVLTSHWDQTSAATGRLSSYQPNIQAIPKSPLTITDFEDNYIIGKETSNRVDIFPRDPFISRDGWTFLAADFQQIELRILAHLIDDPILLQTFNKPGGNDIFVELTSHWYNKHTEEVTPSEREQTKRVVYSVMYGAGKEKLAEYLKMSVSNAAAIMKSFLVSFPAVNQFTRKCVQFCQQNGFTLTIFKRRRMFPNINHPASHLRAQAERQAVNFCMQGSAADLCKAAMLQVVHALKCDPHIKARLLVQIHDELLLEVADENLTEVQGIVKSVMENEDALCGSMTSLKVPLKVSLSTGKLWGHMTPVSQ